jgi:ABC-type transporter Mla subunit MlaD
VDNHDRSIPPDSVKLELIYKEVQEDKDAATKKVTISKVVTRSYYNETLRPVKTDSRRQLRETAVDKIFQTFEWLQQVQPMIGENGVIIQKSLANVKTVLDQLKSNVGSSTEMIQELKTSAFTASKVKESLVEAVASLASQSEEVIHTRARRKLLV